MFDIVRQDRIVRSLLVYTIIPNTAVFCPTNFIGIMITTERMTGWMDEKGRFLNLDF